MAADAVTDYPLGQKRPEAVSTPSGLPLDDVTVEGMRDGRLSWEDLRATPETLRRQADVAEAVERTALADNLRRGARGAAVRGVRAGSDRGLREPRAACRRSRQDLSASVRASGASSGASS